MYKYLWIVFFVLSVHRVDAQIITIRDQVGRQPLEYVSILNRSGSKIVLTDERGQADLSAFELTDTVFIQLMGYQKTEWTKAQLAALGYVLGLEEDVVSLDAVVVSALRWQQPSREAPQKISVIHQREAVLQNPQTAADLLGISGEVFIQKSQMGGGSPMVRGFATNRVLLAVDGIRMNTAIFRSGNLQNVISLDPFATASTELLFGPGSVMYGSDAIAGVLHFRTLTPAFAKNGNYRFNGNATMRYGTANNEKTAHFDFNAGGKKLAFLTSATVSDFGDLQMGSNGPDAYLRPTYVERIQGKDSVVVNPDPRVQHPTAYRQLNLMQKIRFKPNENWEINYGGHFSTTSDFSRYDRLIRPRGNTLRSAEWNYGPQVWMLQSLNALHRATDGIYDALQIRLAYQYFEESRMDRDLNKPTRYVREEQVHAWSANFDFEKRLGENTLYYGLEQVFNLVHSTGVDENVVAGTSKPGPSRYPDGATWNSVGAYVTHVLRLHDKLLLQTGLRYNHFGLDAEFDQSFYPFPFKSVQLRTGAVSGSMGLVYTPVLPMQFSLNVSRGFRMPNVDDMGKVFDSTPGAVVVPNPDLKPEFAHNVDLSVARTFGDMLRIDVTGFYTNLKHALVRRPFDFNGQDSMVYNGTLSRVEALQNAANAYVWGIQAGLELKLPYGFGISSRVNMQQGEEELEDGSTAPLRHAAPLFGATHLTWKTDGFQADLYMLFNGEVANSALAPEEQGKDYLYAKDASGHPYVPAWTTWNIKGVFQASETVSISAGLENIFDVRYRPYSSGISAPGRNLILAVRARF